MSTPMFSEIVRRVKAQVQERHIEQLRTMDLGINIEPGDKKLEFPMPLKDDILRWIQVHKEHIDAATKSQCIGGDRLDWNLALFKLIESASMYLRNGPAVVLAMEAAKHGKHDLAHQFLNESQKDIDEIAEAMGMHFVVLCDLVDVNPEGKRHWSGAFCGLFYPRDEHTAVPCIGVSFKGTNTLHDAWIDLAYTPSAPLGEHLFCQTGVEVHTGFYAGLFGKFNMKQTQETVTPFDLILTGIMTAAGRFDTKPVPVHVTGHSLGGAYASLCYAEMLRLLSTAPASSFELRDLCTFGGPRVGLGRLPELVKQLMQPGTQHSWRVCADGDPVPTIPPPPLPLPGFPYVQFDHGVKVFVDRDPEEMASEIPANPVSPVMPNIINVFHHAPGNYYRCILRAMGKAASE